MIDSSQGPEGSASVAARAHSCVSLHSIDTIKQQAEAMLSELCLDM